VAAGAWRAPALARWCRGCRSGLHGADGARAIDRARFDAAEIDRNPFWCPDPKGRALWATDLDALRKAGNSVGAVIEVVAAACRPGLGAPVYGKLDADLAAAMMSINAVKGVEIGAGMAAAALTGVENADEIAHGAEGPVFGSNHAGGILGGISTGQGGGALRGQADLLDPDAAASMTAPARRPRSPRRAATTPASASARCRWARR
jgi:chorismate synthase